MAIWLGRLVSKVENQSLKGKVESLQARALNKHCQLAFSSYDSSCLDLTELFFCAGEPGVCLLFSC